MSPTVFTSLGLLSYLIYSYIGSCPASAATHKLDLSYQFHVAPSAISASSRKFLYLIIENGPVDRTENCSSISIDISNSNLADEGLDQILSSIIACRNKLTDRNMTIEIDFKAQMNGLTSQGVATFLARLLNSNVSSDGLNETSAYSSFEPIKWRSIDFGWNPLYSSGSSVRLKPLHAAITNLLIASQDGKNGIASLCLSCTGLGSTSCRILAKGLLSRIESEEENHRIGNPLVPLSLFLSYNRDIGDGGAAAFAALIRSVGCNDTEAPIIDTLDLSGCDIGDVGVEALALALEDASASVMIRNLILCHNRISDQGAISLGRALHRNVLGGELHVDLSDNPLISDQGISTLLSAMEKGCLTSLKLRSCAIQADGTELVGKTLRSIAMNPNHKYRNLVIDLSGNPVGILRGKSEKRSIYSASALKSKASATASAYMSQGLSFLKKGFGAVGVSSSVESDDEEEKQQASSRSFVSDTDKSKNMRCGFKSMANSFLEAVTGDGVAADASPKKRICLGLRRTFCDSAGADALAAMLTATKDRLTNIDLNLELDLNPVLEDDMISALQFRNDDLLSEMTERHTEAMEVLRLSHERAMVASRAMAARRENDPFTQNHYEEDFEGDLEDDQDTFETVLGEELNGADSDAEYDSVADYY